MADESLFGDDLASSAATCDTVSGTEDRNQLFDTVVGVLEKAIMNDSFRSETERFCRANCDVFENSDENKLEYMTLFTRYTEHVETYLERALAAAVPGVSLVDVEDLLKEHADDVSGDVFDVLISLGDFDEFKSLMISYKEQVASEALSAVSAAAGAGGLTSLSISGRPLASTASASTNTDDDISGGGLFVSIAGSLSSSSSAVGEGGSDAPAPSLPALSPLVFEGAAAGFVPREPVAAKMSR